MIDTHCHLIDPQFNRDLDDVLIRAKQVGISYIINAGYDIETSQAAVQMYAEEPWLLPAIGVHPTEAAERSIKAMGDIEHLLDHDCIRAIGETGLDYYRDSSPRSAQQELFRRHIRLAKLHRLPLLIHTRNSMDDAISILEQEGHGKGVFHCYSGTAQQAAHIIDMGFFLGFGGIITFSRNAREILRMQPYDRIVLETDAPFLSPSNHRGKRNEPAYIIETLQTAAELFNRSPTDMERICDDNAKHLFSIKTA